MRPIASTFLALSFHLARASSADGAEVVQVAPWELHSSFWMSLHQSLIAEASGASPRLVPAFSAQEESAWNEAVSAYRIAGGRSDMTFARPMAITTDALTQVADDAVAPDFDAPLAAPLRQAAPIYRKHQWETDDGANRFFMGYSAAMLREAGAALVRAHESVYRATWPARIRVYITPSAGPYGAYTMYGLAGGVITTMSCRDTGYQGFRALEMLLHESAHSVVGPVNGTLAAAISAAAKKRGGTPPHDVWHAILFATSSELTRRWLAQRGVAGFVPSSDDLFTRAWPRFRAPIEKYWYAYLDGHGTLEEAVDAIVNAVQPHVRQ